ncbi:uncharacterized protein RCO7_15046 [Rhynchosporium graminicola]|uniref:Uncharacterized protein n=1 Tax=Rhynchosporium graminicola TaxID=2792576 RepID=A0A1E1LHP8_9HELO|nr:uncharacterized protein RCO7_15046 [Rhynchosporium commune]
MGGFLKREWEVYLFLEQKPRWLLGVLTTRSLLGSTPTSNRPSTSLTVHKLSD